MDVFQKTGSRPHEFHRNLIGHRVNLSKPRFDAIHPATTDRLGEYKHGHQASPSHSLRRLLRPQQVPFSSLGPTCRTLIGSLNPKLLARMP
jgi:hypothetical protein